MEKIIQMIMEQTGTTSQGLAWAMFIVGCLIIVFAVIGIVISIFLMVSYIKYNHTKNSAGLTGQDAARKILDDNGLHNIKVSAVGSFLFGNSYSHYFHKVRLRRLTYKKDSISSLAMAAQKSSLAVLDKENDPDMKKRNWMIPFVVFGPLAFIPLVVLGVILDLIINSGPKGVFTCVFAGIGLIFYFVSFLLNIVILRVEVKAQKKAYQILKDKRMVTNEELAMIQKLFKLYNLEYINNIILAFLEMVLRVLQIVAAAQGSSSKSSS